MLPVIFLFLIPHSLFAYAGFPSSSTFAFPKVYWDVRGPMATTSNPPNHPSPRRRSQRVLMQVAVRVRGSDAQGQSFEEEAATLAINAHGALVQLQARLTSGSKVLLQHKHTQEEQECHVVFLGPSVPAERKSAWSSPSLARPSGVWRFRPKTGAQNTPKPAP